MRNELEIIEKIERYLTGQLSAEEQGAFERELAADPELQQKVALQKQLMNGMERIAIKQEIQQAGQNYALKNKLTKFGFGGAGLLLVAIAVWYFVGRGHNHPGGGDSAGGLPAYNEQGGTNWASADSNIQAQIFTIDAARDTVIETAQGIVMAIAANSMLDENKQPIQGQYSLSIKEALDAATIMKAGLSSTSGDKLLESAGMFCVDARKGDKILSINPAKGIYAEVPSASIKGGMQLFSGQRKPDGTIDWVDPKPLVHDLVPVDILSLDFYPPHYLDSVARWGYNKRDKRFTDSLYYSLTEYFYGEREKPVVTATTNENASKASSEPKIEISRRNARANQANKADSATPIQLRVTASDTNSVFRTTCGINPAKIKTIWSTKYQNTLLATREFQQRLKVVHESYSPALLELYVRRLDKNLYETDSIAATIATGERKGKFLAFAARHDGKVNISSMQLKMLSAYYDMKTKAFTMAIVRTQQNIRDREAQMDETARVRKQANDIAKETRMGEDFMKEFEINIRDAYTQLGRAYPYTNARTNTTTARVDTLNTTIIYRAMPTSKAYAMNITTTGWCNIDAFTGTTTATRTSGTFTDKETGKKAELKYAETVIKVDSKSNYDRVYVYLLPVQLNSFVRMPESNGQFTYSLNALIQYDMACVAWKGENCYYYEAKNVQPRTYDHIVLLAITQAELNKKLAMKGNGIKTEQDYLAFEIKDAARREKFQAWEAVRAKVFRMISPCYGEESYDVLIDSNSAIRYSVK